MLGLELGFGRIFGGRLRCGRLGRLRLAGWGRRFGRLPAAAAAMAAARARRRRAALMLRVWLRSLPISVAGETHTPRRDNFFMGLFPLPTQPTPAPSAYDHSCGRFAVRLAFTVGGAALAGMVVAAARWLLLLPAAMVLRTVGVLWLECWVRLLTWLAMRATDSRSRLTGLSTALA
jgi:hypothetical protein